MPFTGAVASWLGADEHRANRLEAAGGRLTGRVVEPIQGADAKLRALKELRARFALAGLGGDGGRRRRQRSADAGRGRASASPIAPSRKSRRRPHARVERGDLTALLFAMGIARADFADA